MLDPRPHQLTGAPLFRYCLACVELAFGHRDRVDEVVIRRTLGPWPTPERINETEMDVIVLEGRARGIAFQEITRLLGPERVVERWASRLCVAYDRVARLYHPDLYDEQEHSA